MMNTCARRSSTRAFTLIELILVLALLVIVTSLAAPSLSRFFRGRAIDSEARQLLSLTHAGQSRAISSGFPVLLWLDSDAHGYGLVEEATPGDRNAQGYDSKAESFEFDDALKIQAVNAASIPVNGRTLPAVRFLPDGSIDDNSPKMFRLESAQGDVLFLVEMTNRLNYAISATGQ